MALNIYTSVAKGSKLKVRKLCGLIPAFVEIKGEKLVGEGGLEEFLYLCHNLTNRTKEYIQKSTIMKELG